MIMYSDCILFLCDEKDLVRERKGYADYLSRHITVLCIKPLYDEPLDELLKRIPEELNVILILHPEASWEIPSGLESVNIPTACFHIDTYAGTDKKIKWAKLFDYVFVFHPSYVKKYTEAGHPNVHFLAHAIEKHLYENTVLKNNNRTYDIGWVGNLKANIYNYRRKVIAILEKEYKMNDIHRYYNGKELSDVYTDSKIVVNISRDDYLKDANLRCFEVMASGALLITPSPSELTEIGFVENIHFRTFRNIDELKKIIDFYLGDEQARLVIAEAARIKVLEEFTYDNRGEEILKLLKGNGAKTYAPVRNYITLEQQSLYLYYYLKRFQVDISFLYLQKIRKQSFVKALSYLPLTLAILIRKFQSAFIK